MTAWLVVRPRRRLAAGELELCSVGRLTLTSFRVILYRKHWWWAWSTAIPLVSIDATTVLVPRWGRARLVVRAGDVRLTVKVEREGVARLRALADAIDEAIARKAP